tara:strand:- start:422 stop:1543 length:1122 start_codon:yes stop_codon:yes gene_type:complete
MVSPVLAVFAGLARGATARAEERNEEEARKKAMALQQSMNLELFKDKLELELEKKEEENLKEKEKEFNSYLTLFKGAGAVNSKLYAEAMLNLPEQLRENIIERSVDESILPETFFTIDNNGAPGPNNLSVASFNPVPAKVDDESIDDQLDTLDIAYLNAKSKEEKQEISNEILRLNNFKLEKEIFFTPASAERQDKLNKIVNSQFTNMLQGVISLPEEFDISSGNLPNILKSLEGDENKGTLFALQNTYDRLERFHQGQAYGKDPAILKAQSVIKENINIQVQKYFDDNINNTNIVKEPIIKENISDTFISPYQHAINNKKLYDEYKEGTIIKFRFKVLGEDSMLTYIWGGSVYNTFKQDGNKYVPILQKRQN